VCVVLLIGACGQREQVVDPVDAVRAEADEIYQLLAYAIVDAQWETGEGARRGHNIGALLVEPDGAPAWWALNNNFAEESAIEHAELRLLRTYFDRRRDGGHPVSRLSGYTVYSTLEPCAMCAGAMIMADVPRVVYGQRDVRWGGAAERLALDTRRKDGMAPYPRALESVASTSAIRARLEQSYSRSDLSRCLSRAGQFQGSPRGKPPHPRDGAWCARTRVRYCAAGGSRSLGTAPRSGARSLAGG
jgi:tRNA(Arg) A34 adenosine deaminase TadA